MADLEHDLTDLANDIDWPRADIVGAVGHRLRTETVPVTSFSRRRGWRVALAAAVAVAAAVLMLPASRAAIGSWLGVRGDHIEARSTASATPPPPATSAAVPTELQLGPQVALGDVRAQVGFTMPVPRAEGFDHPDEVHVSHPPRNGEATLLYRSRPGLPPTGSSDVGMLITAFQADIEPAFFDKVVDPGTRVETVTVQGRTGYWIEGAPHEFFYRDASGEVVPETLRLAANVLLWETNGITVRIESALARDEVVRVADAMT